MGGAAGGISANRGESADEKEPEREGGREETAGERRSWKKEDESSNSAVTMLPAGFLSVQRCSYRLGRRPPPKAKLEDEARPEMGSLRAGRGCASLRGRAGSRKQSRSDDEGKGKRKPAKGEKFFSSVIPGNIQDY